MNKILLIVVVLLVVVLVSLVLWQRGLFGSPTYTAVFLRTGDLYFGQLRQFPTLTLHNVYLLQITQDPQAPLSLQKFTNVIWGPEDKIKLNRDQVVWMSRLRSDSQFVQAIERGPVPVGQQQLQQQLQQLPPQSQGE
ncbi:MAG: hypothetical protein IIC11_10790 [Proteobacteria bacterium]|nr:hypothetical protein [Pseudomonadota bacterium]